jgi:hypothetical protein
MELSIRQNALFNQLYKSFSIHQRIKENKKDANPIKQDTCPRDVHCNKGIISGGLTKLFRLNLISTH